MNFFEQQDIARKKTGRLVGLFIAAVIGIIAALFGVIELLIALASRPAGAAGPHPGPPPLALTPQDHLLIFLVVAAVVLLIVLLGSLTKMSALRAAGGAGVAEMLGGRRLSPDTTDPLERKVLNVVEEMAIASGTPVPPVYMLDHEKAINAFAAGFHPGDAVIGITRGCAEKLTREQLQGVVAHEFSHIINGDMRLNIRLMGLVHGILVIALIGWMTLRSLHFVRISGNRKGGGGAVVLAILIVGLAMVALGFIGQLFGSLIKAAVSRQREYLADASAVQYTRNPYGIGGALMAIAASSTGSKVLHPNAPQASHMFFGQAVTALGRMFATHPPIEDRIKRILPDWDGDLSAAQRKLATSAPPQTPDDRPDRRAAARRMAGLAVTAGVLDSIGRPTPQHVRHAEQLLQTIPQPLRDAAREPFGSRAVIYGLLLDQRPDVRKTQLDQLHQQADPAVLAEVQRLLESFSQLPPQARLPLIDLALPALRSLTADQFRTFQANVDRLIAADQRIDLFEWTLRKILHHHLAGQFHPSAVKTPATLSSLVAAAENLSLLLSTLAHLGSPDPQQARRAFDAGTATLGLADLQFLDRSACSLKNLDHALDRLAGLTPPLKQRLLAAALATIAADRAITIEEAELFRALADVLDVPVPPILPDGPA